MGQIMASEWLLADRYSNSRDNSVSRPAESTGAVCIAGRELCPDEIAGSISAGCRVNSSVKWRIIDGYFLAGESAFIDRGAADRRRDWQILPV